MCACAQLPVAWDTVRSTSGSSTEKRKAAKVGVLSTSQAKVRTVVWCDVVCHYVVMWDGGEFVVYRDVAW